MNPNISSSRDFTNVKVNDLVSHNSKFYRVERVNAKSFAVTIDGRRLNFSRSGGKETQNNFRPKYVESARTDEERALVYVRIAYNELTTFLHKNNYYDAPLEVRQTYLTLASALGVKMPEIPHFKGCNCVVCSNLFAEPANVG